MLHAPELKTLQTSEDRERRVQELTDQLLPRLQQAARQLAETLAALPDDQLLGAVEHALRDQAHQLATDVHQASLHGRKKGATREPVSSARTAATTAASRATGHARS